MAAGNINIADDSTSHLCAAGTDCFAEHVNLFLMSMVDMEVMDLSERSLEAQERQARAQLEVHCLVP